MNQTTMDLNGLPGMKDEDLGPIRIAQDRTDFEIL